MIFGGSFLSLPEWVSNCFNLHFKEGKEVMTLCDLDTYPECFSTYSWSGNRSERLLFWTALILFTLGLIFEFAWSQMFWKHYQWNHGYCKYHSTAFLVQGKLTQMCEFFQLSSGTRAITHAVTRNMLADRLLNSQTWHKQSTELLLSVLLKAVTHTGRWPCLKFVFKGLIILHQQPWEQMCWQ